MNNEITIYTNEYIDCLVKQLEHFSEMMLYAFIAMPCICLCFLPQNFIKLDTMHTAAGTVICILACLMLAFQTFLWAKQKAVNKDRLRIISGKKGKKSRITSLLMKVERRMWIILFSVSLSLWSCRYICFPFCVGNAAGESEDYMGSHDGCLCNGYHSSEGFSQKQALPVVEKEY